MPLPGLSLKMFPVLFTKPASAMQMMTVPWVITEQQDGKKAYPECLQGAELLNGHGPFIAGLLHEQ